MTETTIKNYAKKRYFAFALITFVGLVLPFITINSSHFFLLNFDHKRLELFFHTFDMQELFVMPFVLIMSFMFIFFITTLGGRVWCGWSCPQTIFRSIYRDLIQTKLLGIYKNINNKQKAPSANIFKRFIAVLIWAVFAFIAASNFTWYFVPPEDFFTYIANPAQHPVLIGMIFIIAAFLIYDIAILKEKFCAYVCPYARIQSALYDINTIQAIYDNKRGGNIYDENGNKLSKKEVLANQEDAECIACEKCVQICPTHIDIRKGMQLECINCLECVDACSEVMAKKGKESLVAWTSDNYIQNRINTKFVRLRTVGYAVAIMLAFIMMLVMSGKKENMLLNINRTTQLYEIKDQGKTIENAYIFLFQNTDRKDHKYYFSVDNPDISIIRPSKEFALKAGSKLKKIVILRANKKLTDLNVREDKPLPIIITAYATDEKEKIIITRPAIFVYPKQSEIDAKARE